VLFQILIDARLSMWQKAFSFLQPWPRRISRRFSVALHNKKTGHAF